MGHRALPHLGFWYDSTLLSYAQVLLTSRMWLGWIALAATALEPSMALAGLCAVFAANGGARLLKFNRDTIRTGYYGFNALLVGLALAYYYRLNLPLLLLIVVGSLVTLWLTVGLTSLMSYYLQLPALSLPFVIVTPLAYLAAGAASGLELEPKSLAITGVMLSLDLPPIVEAFFRSLGSIFFMPSLGAGAVLFLGLLLVSRALAIFAALGYLTGFALFVFLGVSPSILTHGMLGFNLMLTAMVLGGVFVIPSPASYALAVGASVVCALVAVAMRAFLTPFDLPVLTSPFILTTLLVLYTLKFREHDAQPRLVTFLPGTPEENLDYASTRMKRFGSYELIRFSLPFYGEWSVPQGIQGPYTHQEKWTFAWDFVVVDEEGKPFNRAGHRPSEYYAYRLPVLAPAEGTVVRVVDWVPENEIGFINARDNWGNLVVIRHAAQLYSVLAHLAPGTIRVREGAYVSRGDVLALCGNSGRSVEPHLHFHVQDGPDLGARSICPAFTRFVRRDENGSGALVAQQTLPAAGQRVRNLEIDPFLAGALNLPIGKRLAFRVATPERTREEEWVVSVDFTGTLFLESAPNRARAWIWTGEGAFTVLGYTGRTDTALFAFAVGASLVPLMYDRRLRWEDTLSYRYFLRGPSRMAADVLRPFLELVTARARMRFGPFENRKVDEQALDTCRVESEITVASALGGGRGHRWKTAVALERTLGPVFLRVESPRGWVLEAEAKTTG